MTATLKFSQFPGPFSSVNGDIVVGLRNGVNTQFYSPGGSTVGAWQTVSTDTSLLVNNGYFSNGIGQLTHTLPPTFSEGQQIIVAGLSAGGFILQYTFGINIVFLGGLSTTTSGTVISTTRGDAIILVGAVPDTTWFALLYSDSLQVT
jgi:hypothetical protein